MTKDEVLGTIRELARRRASLDEQEEHLVRWARSLGVSWREIAGALGKDPSATWRKYR